MRQRHIRIINDAGVSLGIVVQKLSFHTAPFELFKYGECGELSAALILELMKEQIPEISWYSIVHGKADHAFVVIKNDDGIEYALNPFFDQIMTLKEYWSNPSLLSFMRAVSGNSSWVPRGEKYESGSTRSKFMVYI